MLLQLLLRDAAHASQLWVIVLVNESHCAAPEACSVLVLVKSTGKILRIERNLPLENV